jgi:hypothetical protein
MGEVISERLEQNIVFTNMMLSLPIRTVAFCCYPSSAMALPVAIG